MADVAQPQGCATSYMRFFFARFFRVGCSFMSLCCLGGMRPSAAMRRFVSSRESSRAMTDTPDRSLDPDIVEILGRLSEDQTKLIGEITILWNALEHQFTKIIWLGAHLPDAVGEFISADLPNVARIKLVQNLVRHHFNNPADFAALTYIETVVDLFDQCRIERNDIVHGLPVTKGDTNAEAFEKRTAKKATGKIVIVRNDVSIEHLKQFKSDLSWLWTAIDGAGGMLWLHHLMDIGSLTKTHRAQNFERCKRIDIDRLQKILERLRRRHSNGHNNPEQRPS